MKRLTAIVLAFWLLSLPLFAENKAASASLYIDGKPLTCEVLLVGGASFVPARMFCDENGFRIGWDEKTRNVVIMGEGVFAVFKDQSREIYMEDMQGVMPAACFIRSGTFYIPVRGIGTLLKKKVSWDEKTRSVYIGTKPVVTEERDDLYWLSRIINAESQGESLEGKIAVGNVVLNRVASPDFPNTVYDVVFDRNYGVQFTPVLLGTVYNEPTQESIEAARRCLAGEEAVEDCLYFFNPYTSTAQGWIVANRVFCRSIGNHDFYY